MGLVYLRARYYDPRVGRFITPDDIIPDPLRSQAWNKYVYAENNPVKFVDPSGYQGGLPDWEQIVRGFRDWACAGWLSISQCPIDTFIQATGILPTSPSEVTKELQERTGPLLIDPEEVEALDAFQEGVEQGEQLAQTLPPVNSLGEPYPTVIDPRTGGPIPFPDNCQWAPPEERVSWGKEERGEFIREWYERGYAEPPGGWEEYDIHHIRPREYGGTNDFENLVPVLRETHQQELTPWWNNFGGRP